MATNTYQWQTPRARGPKPAVYRAEVDPTAALAAQVELLSKKIEQLHMPVQAAQPRCEFCRGPHYSANCNAGGMFASSMPTNVSNFEHVDYVDESKKEDKPEEKGKEVVEEKEDSKKIPLRLYQPPIAYPTRLKHDKVDQQFGKFLDLFKQLRINLPFIEAISQMAKYVKFLKEILTNKRKLEDLGLVTLNAKCSAMFQSKIPVKRRDPGSFTIPCLIGDKLKLLALADLGASINLMASSLFKELGLSTSKLTPTRMSIQLADRTVKYPKGIIEDVLVRVDKFIFPVDFVVMDMNGESDVPLILGRPFLAISKALIDNSGKLKLRVDDESITFDLTKSLRHPYEHDGTMCSIDFVDDIVESQLQEMLIDDPL
ncbi:uncharacterized protein LOC125369853 [Ricinus communis]|uniref:uncharacterized protein LOC125369853 n=1 Tax=Ricinus communis TaxID=3988 RepID=UPI00201AEA40|nr:uncharacterized protein LOC125369853 [Ricinus communis]